MEKLTGTSAQMVLGKGDYVCGSAIYGEKRPCLADLVLENNPMSNNWKLYKNLTKAEGIYSVVVANTHLKEKEIYLWASAQPLLDRMGKVIGAIESLRDVTERQVKDTKLQEKIEDLSKLNRAMVDREKKMVELKEKIKQLGGTAD